MAPSYFWGTNVCITIFGSVLLFDKRFIIAPLVTDSIGLTKLQCCVTAVYIIICHEPLIASGAHTIVSGERMIISGEYMMISVENARTSHEQQLPKQILQWVLSMGRDAVRTENVTVLQHISIHNIL